MLGYPFFGGSFLIIFHLLPGVQRDPWLTVIPLLGVTADQPALVLQADPQCGHHHHHLLLSLRLRLRQVEESLLRALDINELSPTSQEI